MGEPKVKSNKIKYTQDEKQFIVDLVKSLNIGNCGSIDCRVEYAIKQFNQLKEANII